MPSVLTSTDVRGSTHWCVKVAAPPTGSRRVATCQCRYRVEDTTLDASEFGRLAPVRNTGSLDENRGLVASFEKHQRLVPKDGFEELAAKFKT